MDRDAYIDWLEQIEIDLLISLAEDWGQQVANYSTMGGTDLEKLQTFNQFLVDYYNGVIASDPGYYGDDSAYDNLDRSGDRE